MVELLYPEIGVIKQLEKAGIDELSISINASNAKRYCKIGQAKFGLKS
ncbi:MAG: hypothetical protein GF308_13540, partial [Candidatus Heimdallarchaeota archaeon]|nr:hypothetical protein [Candidatus Heimdallarchaeota archaeon]